MEVIEQIWTAIRTGTPPDLGYWTYLILALLVFIEGPAVTLVAGAMAAAGILRVDLVFISSLIGNFAADYWWYFVGYFAGSQRASGRFRLMRRWDSQVERLESSVREHGARLFLITKLSLGILTIPTLIAAGVVRIPWYRLVIISIFVEPVWTGLMVTLGYFFGAYIAQLERGLQVVSLVGGVIVLLVAIWLYRRMFRRITHMDNAIL